MLTIKLSKEIEKRLTALAQATGRTKTFYTREAILEHLEDICLAEKRLEDVRTGRSVTIPLEEVMRHYDLKIESFNKQNLWKEVKWKP